MSETDRTSELEATKMENGSGPAVDPGTETVSEKKDGKEQKDVEEMKNGGENNCVEEMKNGEEKNSVEGMNNGDGKNSLEETKDGDGKNSVKEMKDVDKKNTVQEMKDAEEKNGVGEMKDGEEKKCGEENGVRMVDYEEEGKEEKKTEDVNMDEAEDVKVAEAGDVKDEEKAGIEVGQEEDGVELEDEDGAKEGEGIGNTDEKANEKKEIVGLKKKRSRGRKVGEKGEPKEKKQVAKKANEVLSTPTPSSIERPVRERKSVERLVEVIEKETNKGILIEKGRGTPLKDIPNVAYKLARNKPADLKLLHQTLFGRIGKAVDFKNHILQFSGFVWHESDEKQRAKIKEKLDKCVKDTLLDLCDLFDIPVSKTNTKKEDLVVKLLDFMAAPHATTDVMLAEKEQQSAKSRKRKRVARGIESKNMGGMAVKRSRKSKSEGTINTKRKSVQDSVDVDGGEEEDNENDVPDEDETVRHSESDLKEDESEESADEDDDLDSGKGKRDAKKSSKQQGSVGTEKMKVGITSKKTRPGTSIKSPTKMQSYKLSKAEEGNDVGAKVFSRKKKNIDSPKKKSTSKPDTKEKSTGKQVARGKTKSAEAGQSGPSKEELRKAICEILKEVDFNTATFTDILKQLATHYKMDLTPRKAAIKIMIQDELTKLADEAEENEDDEEEENPGPAGKEVEA